MEPIIAGMILLIALPESLCKICLYGESELCGQVQKVIKPKYWILYCVFFKYGFVFFLLSDPSHKQAHIGIQGSQIKFLYKE